MDYFSLAMKCISVLSQCVYLKMNMLGSLHLLAYQFPKFLWQARKKTTKITPHKNLVRKCDFTFTGHAAVCLKTGLCISCQSAEDHFQWGRGGKSVCGCFPLIPQVRFVT